MTTPTLAAKPFARRHSQPTIDSESQPTTDPGLPRGLRGAVRAGVIAAGMLALGAAAPASAATTGAAAASAPPVLVSLDFAPALQTVSQGARVHLVNLADNTPQGGIPPGPCHVTVQFVDIAGSPLGAPAIGDIAPGQTQTFVAPVFLTNGLPLVLHAHVALGPAPVGVPPGPCRRLLGSYEVYDSQTLETRLLNPGVIRGFNPQPDPPAN
jgi:hypothetical protein